MRIAAVTYRIASGHRRTILTRWLLLSAQLERRAIFILFFLFVRIPDFFEAVLTDDMFNQAGGIFCSKQTVFRAFCMKMPGRKLDGVPLCLLNFDSNKNFSISIKQRISK
jgi:hypothetical protein